MTPVASVFWRRLDAPGHDACRLTRSPSGWRLEGACLFGVADGAASLRYRVDCDRAWRARAGRFEGHVGDRAVRATIRRQGPVWTLNGDVVQGVDGLLDLDLSFTPATNLAQLQRLRLLVGERAEGPVAWFDLDALRLTGLPQVYERTDPLAYAYAAPSVGYAGRLEMLENGFVRLYPGLWEAVPPT